MHVRLNKILEGFNTYKEIVNKDIIYIYDKNGTYEKLVLKAKKYNFMHLCGVKYRNPDNNKIVKASLFYDLIENSMILPEYIEINSNGSTDQKLDVIQYLDELLKSNIRIIDDDIYFLNSSFNGSIRTSKMIFALGLNNEKGNEYGPKSLMNLKINKRDSFKNSFKVHKIYYDNKKTGDQHVFFESEEYKKRTTSFK